MMKTMLVKPGSKVNLDDHNPDFHEGLDKDDPEVERRRDRALERTCELQEALFAEARQSLLIVLQAMDTGGKDGVINHVMRGLNPQGVHVRSFKVPTPEELAHDFLWRVHQRVPARGHITVFNRSHYEDVLVVRVHELVPENMWRKRYEQINEFEQLLAENGTRILKLFLHISKDEQKQRLQERLDDPSKHWKFSVGDLEERKLWDHYMRAYEDALTECSTETAPWHIVPANRKWYRNLVISELLAEVLAEMDPQLPKADFDPSQVVIE